MDIGGKALWFIASALGREIVRHEQELQRTDLDDDALSDLNNDLYFMQSLVVTIRAALEAEAGGPLRDRQDP